MEDARGCTVAQLWVLPAKRSWREGKAGEPGTANGPAAMPAGLRHGRRLARLKLSGSRRSCDHPGSPVLVSTSRNAVRTTFTTKKGAAVANPVPAGSDVSSGTYRCTAGTRLRWGSQLGVARAKSLVGLGDVGEWSQ